MDAADFSVESAATGVVGLTGEISAGGDDVITECIVRSRLRRQFATISSPRKDPYCSTFCSGGGNTGLGVGGFVGFDRDSMGGSLGVGVRDSGDCCVGTTGDAPGRIRTVRIINYIRLAGGCFFKQVIVLFYFM